MTDKKKNQAQLNFNVQKGLEPEPNINWDTPYHAEPVLEPVPDLAPQLNPYWEEREWMMGQLTVYRCRECGTDRDQEDTIIEHILLHYPAGEEQEQKLTELLALKKKE